MERATSETLRGALTRVREARHAISLALVTVAGVWIVASSVGAGRITPERPEVAADPPWPLEIATSRLDFPVRIQLSVLLAQVERHVPAQWGTLDDPIRLPDAGRTAASVALQRSPFRASLSGTTARVSATVFYALSASYDLPLLPDIGLSCGTDEDEPRPRLDVTLETPVTLSSDWRLGTRTRLVGVSPTSTDDRDRCQVTLAGIDVTGSVVEAARTFLEEHGSTIDSVVSEADVRSGFESWWDELTKPIALGPRLWLELRPTGIRRGPVEGSGDVLDIQAQLEARPRVTVGPRPRRWPVALPRLGDEVSDGGLQILVEGVAEYSETSRLLTDALAGASFRVGRRGLEIESLEIGGIGGGRVALEVRIRGDARGSLFLVGTPRYDPAGYVTVPDLALSTSTSNALLASASWVLDAGLEIVLRDRARWPADEVVAWAQDALTTGLNTTLTDGVRLSGTVGGVSVSQIAATTGGLVVRGQAHGEAALLIGDYD